MKHIYKILFIFLFFISFKILSQEPSLKNYDITKGLPSNECYKVLQDKKGYIWIASDAGVSRYNGYTFQNFTKKDGLPDNVIIHLFEDAKGKIWVIGVNARIACFENDSFHYAKELNVFLEKTIKRAQILSAYVDDKDELHIGFDLFYPHLVTYNILTKKITIHEIIPDNWLYLKTDKENQFAYGVCGGSVVNLQIKIEHANEPAYKLAAPITRRSVISRYLQLNGTDCLISFDSRLLRIYGKKITEVMKFNTPILFIYKDCKGKIWALVQNDGAYIFDTEKINSQPPLHIFEGYDFSSMTEDKENNYWLSSLKAGIYQIPNFDIVHYQVKSQDKNIRMNVVEKLHNKIYAAGLSPNIYTLNNLKNAVSCFEIPNKIVEIYDMRAQQDNLMMVGSSCYVVNFSTSKNKIKEVENRNGKKTYNSYLRYFDVCVIKGKNIRVGNTRGCSVLNLDSYTNEFYYPLPPSTVNISYTDTINNKTYIACTNGLYYTTDFKTYIKINDSLLNTRINYVFKKDGLFILCSKERGVIFWNGKKAWNVDVTDGLAGNDCRKALLDKQGNLWVATNNGLSKIEKSTNQKPVINNIKSIEGLVSDDIYNFNLIDDIIWIPTISGVTKFSTTLDIKSNTTIPVYITNIAVDDSLYKINSFSEIPYNHNYIKINFNGLYYKNNENIVYEYRLTGLDSAWKKTKNTQVQFTKLTAGKYVFEIRVLKNNHIQSAKPAVFSFVIYPPWYKTWWFMLLSFVSIIMIIYLFFLFRFKRFKAREEEKTRLITLVTETEIKALRAQTNPHFIFNALNSIRLFILKNDSEQAQFYLMQFAQLMRDVLENSEHDVIYLNKEFSILKTYIELESLRFSKKFKFEINIPEEIEKGEIPIPPLLLQPIIENALWHGLMPLEDREGFLMLKIDRKNASVIITIEDNGIGREKSAQIKIGKSNHKTSKGISITTNRIDLFNKKHREQIKIITTDLEIGTRVELIIENV